MGIFIVFPDQNSMRNPKKLVFISENDPFVKKRGYAPHDQNPIFCLENVVKNISTNHSF